MTDAARASHSPAGYGAPAAVLRFLGSFVVGGVFALGLFGVAPEPALAMVLIVEMANILSIAGVGAISLWAQGIALRDLRAAKDAQR